MGIVAANEQKHFTGDFLRISKREDTMWDGDVKEAVQVTQIKVHYSTEQYEWIGPNPSPNYSKRDKTYAYTHIQTYYKVMGANNTPGDTIRVAAFRRRRVCHPLDVVLTAAYWVSSGTCR